MTGGGFIIEGRTFRTPADYQAGLRDQRKISNCRNNTDLHNLKAVQELYDRLQAGEYRFETMLGSDFEDEISDLLIELKEKKSAPKKRKDRKKAKEASKSSLSDYDEEMQREILLQLQKQEKKRKKIIFFCGLTAVVCLSYFAVYNYFSLRTQNQASGLSELKNKGGIGNVVVNKTGNGETPDILEDYQILYNKNKSLIGWIKIDDTVINYPVMQAKDSEYYLTHNFEQEYDKNGSIFLDPECDVLKPSTNLIVYGHHMKSGKMFGSLSQYSNKSYYKEHPEIQFDSLYEKGTYRIMYVFRSRIFYEDEIVFKYYQFIDANSEAEFNSAMEAMAEMSLYDTGVQAQYGDKLLTLSTCDNSEEDGRFVVVAKRVR